MNAWPTGDTLSLGCPVISTSSHVSMLGYDGTISMTKKSGGGVDIKLSEIPANRLPAQWAWVFVIDKVQGSQVPLT